MSEHAGRQNDVAIVGLSARLPGAPTLEDFWRNLRDGVESVTFLSPEPPVIRKGLAHVRAVPRLDGMETFDAAFFGFNPREAETMDPQIRAFLEVSWHALESAGCDPGQYPGRIGVFAGCAFSTYLTGHLLPNIEVMRSSGGGLSSLGQFNDRDSLSTIVAYKFDLTGPAFTVQTFCSTSLVAVHLACQSLLSGESDLVLAGGSSINPATSGGYVFQEGGILSPDGHTRTFDEKAGGTVFGNGVGVVVLKRLEDALADGDVIHAVVRGSAINNDGAQKAGYSAPSVIGQSKAIAEAMAVAQVQPDAISYVEAHGTATALGDPIEIEALTRAFRMGTERKGYCAIGSVKTNFGHLDRAAGVAALVKTVLALKHRQIPPSLHFERPNPKIDFAASPFFVNTELREWEANGRPRVAGVSALGVGGTNAHVILEEAPPNPPSGDSRPAQLLVLSARTEPALAQAAANLARHLRTRPEQKLADVALTLLTGRRRFERRMALVAESASEAALLLEQGDPRKVFTAHEQATERPVVFLFPGQGAQYPGMTRGLYEDEPSFRKDVDACVERLRAPLGLDLRALLYPEEPARDEAGEKLRQTAFTQPALFVVEYALARLLMRWGIKPQCMVGHSVGEYVAAHLAGVFSLEDALALVAERGRLMQSVAPGSMLAVALPASELDGLVREPLALAAVNAPRLCVVSGPTPAIDALEETLRGREVFTTRLHTSHAFHSSMMDGILEAFTERVRSVRLQAPKLPVVSNLTGAFITEAQARDPRYWADHLRGTVRFSDGLATLWSEPDRVLLEVGPGNALASLARQQPGAAAGARVAVSCLRHPQDSQSDLDALLGAVGKLWTAGAVVNGRLLHAGEKRQRVELPLYPFERERYWIDPPDPRARPAARGEAVRRDPSEWFYLPTWRSAPPARIFAADAASADEGWLLFVDAGGLGHRLVRRLREEGARVVTVEAGPAFAGSLDEGYRLDPGSRSDYDRLFQELKSAGWMPGRIVHGFAVEGGAGADSAPAGRLEHGYFSLFFLAQALAARRASEPLQLKVLTSHMHSVLPTDPVHPETRMLLGLAHVIPQEQHNLRCACVDVPAAGEPIWEEGDALGALVEELRADVPGVMAAHRAGQRWVQGFEPLKLEAPTARPARLREGGVYLVTGGLGGVTFVLCAYLAHAVKARLVLTGRSVLPPREEWPAWLAAHGEQDPMSIRISRVERLEKIGAEVLLVSADSGDLGQMEAAVAEAEARFGEIHGVIHGAGIVGGNTFRPLAVLGRADCEEQFHPKVAGLEVLERVLGGRRLDFCMLTSSLSSILGGFGYAAYAAANLFMDAFAEIQNRRGGTPWISVNWDEWRLSPSDPEGPAGSGLAQFAMAPAEGASALGRILGLRGVGQVVVSSGDLDARIERWVRLTGLHRPAGAQAKDQAIKGHPRPNLSNAFVAPSTPTEEKVAAIWQGLLGIEKVGIHDNFFELGGHSLLAIQLVTEIRSELDVEVSVATLFEGPTVESLSRLINPATAEPAAPDLSGERGARRKEQSLRRQALREQSVR